MNRLWIAIAEIPVAVVAVVIAVLCWHSGVQTAEFAASSDTPAYASTSYSGSWIALAFVLLAVAAVLVIDALRRWRSPVEAERADT